MAENLRIKTVDFQSFRTVTVQERNEPKRGQCSLFSEPLDTVLLLPLPRTRVYLHSIL
jgi:hypothetical protein